MQNIEALYNAGSKVIVDDISYGDEPFFQDGLIAQGVDYVTARGDEYFSAAANSGTDQGYLSAFPPVAATVNRTAGTWQNFNPGGTAASELLPVSTGVDNAFINFQYDQPFKTQEPAGATATTTSDLSFYVHRSARAGRRLSTDDNVATQRPTRRSRSLPQATISWRSSWCQARRPVTSNSWARHRTTASR